MRGKAGELTMQVRVTRWGKGLGVRIPEELAARLGLCKGSRVELTAEAGYLVLSLSRPRYRLADLLVGMTPEALHEAFDWGEERGRERVG
jgi:antitoxin MazE